MRMHFKDRVVDVNYKHHESGADVMMMRTDEGWFAAATREGYMESTGSAVTDRDFAIEEAVRLLEQRIREVKE